MSSTAQPIVNYKTYIRKVLKQVHPNTGINANALSQINSMLNTLANRIIAKASFLVKKTNIGKTLKNHKKTISARDIQTATRLIIPGELSKYAVSEGTKAVTKYSISNKRGSKSKPVTKSSHAGLQFSVGRIDTQIRNKCGNCRVSADTAVYLAAVLEYLTAEILELAGNAARDNKRTRITARHIFLAIANDEELDVIFKDRVVIAGGILPDMAIPKR